MPPNLWKPPPNTTPRNLKARTMTAPASRKTPQEPAPTPQRCRGCGRPLTSAVSLLVGYGPRCAARRWKARNDDKNAASAMLSAVALVNAEIQNLDAASVNLMDGIDPAAVIRCLSAIAARLLVFYPERGLEPLQQLAAFAVTGVEDTR